jgi:hypothetical protein
MAGARRLFLVGPMKNLPSPGEVLLPRFFLVDSVAFYILLQKKHFL